MQATVTVVHVYTQPTLDAAFKAAMAFSAVLGVDKGVGNTIGKTLGGYRVTADDNKAVDFLVKRA